jgi:hypothetical protein
MADTYRITPHGPEFIVIHNAGVTVGVYNTEQEAQLTVEDCERDDSMLQKCGCRSAHAIASYRPTNGARLD